MNALHDILLPSPVPETLVRGLLFAAFALHLLFVLMMLGTGILGFGYFLQAGGARNWRAQSGLHSSPSCVGTSTSCACSSSTRAWPSCSASGRCC